MARNDVNNSHRRRQACLGHHYFSASTTCVAFIIEPSFGCAPTHPSTCSCLHTFAHSLLYLFTFSHSCNSLGSRHGISHTHLAGCVASPSNSQETVLPDAPMPVLPNHQVCQECCVTLGAQSGVLRNARTDEISKANRMLHFRLVCPV